MAELIRISKLMADRGLCSRREADRLIEQGYVLVEGSAATLGQKALPSCTIEISKSGAQWLDDKVTFVIHKPVGYVSAQAEKDYTPAIRLLNRQTQFKKQGEKSEFQKKHLDNLAPAGRLDIDSKGLLILTQDGVLAKKIIGADSPISKKYIVKVQGKVTPQKIENLCHGLELDGKLLKKAEVKLLRPELLEFTLWEGRKRQIRRMCKAVELKVLSLKRTHVGPIELNNLPEGQWRYLSPREKTHILSITNAKE